MTACSQIPSYAASIQASTAKSTPPYTGFFIRSTSTSASILSLSFASIVDDLCDRRCYISIFSTKRNGNGEKENERDEISNILPGGRSVSHLVGLEATEDYTLNVKCSLKSCIPGSSYFSACTVIGSR